MKPRRRAAAAPSPGRSPGVSPAGRRTAQSPPFREGAREKEEKFRMKSLILAQDER